MQKVYGDVVAQQMRDTRTGIVKGTFWTFYQEAQAISYTPTNIKSAWRATGIVPYNPDAVLTKLLGYKASQVAQRVPKVSTTLRAFKFLKAPANLQDLRQQTLSAIEHIGCDTTMSDVAKQSSILLLWRIIHQSEAALTRAQILEIETADIHRNYAGKQAPRPNRSKMSTVRVIDNSAIDRPREEDATKEEEKRQREAVKAAKGVRGAGRG